MKLRIEFYFLLAIGFMNWKSTRGEIILTEDKEYEPIKIKIPQKVWKEAWKPTPVLKSAATIVVPIHVAQEDDNEVDESEVAEDVVETEVTEPSQIIETTSITNIVNDDIEIQVLNQTQVTNDPVSTANSTVLGQVIRFPCSCVNGQCGCCTGSILDRVRMKACGNITFIPEDFMFDVKLSVNNNTVVRRRVSASDPPPICFNPRRAPFVQVCAEISNIRIQNRNAFACLDIEADIGGFPVYSASFRCFGLGASGVQTGLKPKPASSGPAPVSLFGNNNNDDDDDDDDDGVLGGGLFGGGSNDDDDDGGPLDGIGDAIGEFFDGRKLSL